MHAWVTAYSERLCLLAPIAQMPALVREMASDGHRFSTTHHSTLDDLRQHVASRQMVVQMPLPASDAHSDNSHVHAYLELLKRLQQEAVQPQVLVITSNAKADFRKQLFTLGVSDVLLSPYLTPELHWRIKRLWQELREQTQMGPCHLDLEMGELRHALSHKQCRLTVAERRVLATLVQAKGHVVTRSDLIQAMRAVNPEGRSLNTIVLRLRKKLIELGPHCPQILTVPKRGYRIGDGA